MTIPDYASSPPDAQGVTSQTASAFEYIIAGYWSYPGCPDDIGPPELDLPRLFGKDGMPLPFVVYTLPELTIGSPREWLADPSKTGFALVDSVP